MPARQTTTSTEVAREIDDAAVRRQQLARDPQPESQARVVAARHRALEAAEDPFAIPGGDADALVLERHRHAGRGIGAAHGDGDRLSGAVLHRVGEKIRDDLLETVRIPAADAVADRRDAYVASSTGSVVSETLARLLDELLEIDVRGLQLDSGLGEARHVEQVIDELRKSERMAERLVEPRHEPRRIVRERAAPARDAQALDVEDPRGQRRPELVAGYGYSSGMPLRRTLGTPCFAFASGGASSSYPGAVASRESASAKPASRAATSFAKYTWPSAP